MKQRTLTLLLLVCIASLVLVSAGSASPPRALAHPDYATFISKMADGCLARAAALDQKIENCRQYLAANPGGSCSVTYETRKFSMETASSMAGTFRANAAQLQAGLPEIKKLQLKVDADETAIRVLGFQRTAEDFKEWESLSKDAQAEFQMKLAEVAIGNVLVGAKEAVATAKSLNPWNAQKIIGKFKDAGLEDPKLFAAIRRLANTNAAGKTAWIKDWQEVVDSLKRIKDTFFVGVSAGKEGHIDKKILLEALATALSWLLKDPVLELIVLDVQIAAAYVYAATAVVQVDNLTRLTEAQLKSLSELKQRTEDDWAQLNQLLRSLPQPCSLQSVNRNVGL